MNIWGKVFAWTSLVLGLVAFYLSARAADFHYQWMKQVAQNRETIERNAVALAEKRDRAADIRAAYDRTMLGWDKYWDGVTARVAQAAQDPNDPLRRVQVVLGIGRPYIDDKDRQGNPVVPTVHAFQPAPDGSWEYVGEFRAVRIGQGESTFVNNWRLRPGEEQRWRPANNWRLRTQIPTSEQVQFADLEVQFVIADELLNHKLEDQARQEELLQLAEQHLKLRTGEIEGFDDLQAPNVETEALPEELTQGVLTTLVKAEEERNAALAEVDRLLRELHETREEFEATYQENVELTKRLPGATETAPAAQVSQR